LSDSTIEYRTSSATASDLHNPRLR
jgi:hypothetical protein